MTEAQKNERRRKNRESQKKCREKKKKNRNNRNDENLSLPLTLDPYFKSPTSSSPVIQKIYDLKRPKITVTMDELENADDSEEEYESYETNARTSQRLQPHRNCKSQKIMVSDESGETK